jgi:hypothetical protein
MHINSNNMNYLCKYVETGKYFVISNVTHKDLSSYIGDKSKTVSFGGPFFRVIQEIEIR